LSKTVVLRQFRINIKKLFLPADTTPVKMDDTATAVGIPRRKAPIAPVQAPVPGRGMPTNAAKEAHCFSIDPTPREEDFFSARSKIGFMAFLVKKIIISLVTSFQK